MLQHVHQRDHVGPARPLRCGPIGKQHLASHAPLRLTALSRINAEAAR